MSILRDFFSVYTDSFFFSDLFWPGVQLFILFSPVWAPIMLGALAWKIHQNYKRAKYINEKIVGGAVLFEISFPRQINRTPLAMELVTQVFSQSSAGGNKWKQFWEGNIPPWFSLEIVSFGGDIRFYVWTPKFFKNHVENQIYSQYPEVIIKEVEDYTKNVDYGQPGSMWDLRGWDFELSEADPIPIKTYVDYELDKPTMSMPGMPSITAQKVDPMTPMLEILGSIDPNDQLWVQILIRAAEKRHSVKKKKTSWLTGKEVEIKETGKDWTKAADELVGELMAKQKDGKLSPGGMDKIKAIERSKTKTGFDCGIRAIYLTKKYEVVDPETGEVETKGLVPSRWLRGMALWKSFAEGNLNSFKATRGTSIEYPSWQDPFNIRLPRMLWKKFDAYRRRSWFWLPYKYKAYILTSEEIATLYHFPGEIAQTPSLQRIESRRGKPPMNLPL